MWTIRAVEPPFIGCWTYRIIHLSFVQCSYTHSVLHSTYSNHKWSTWYTFRIHQCSSSMDRNIVEGILRSHPSLLNQITSLYMFPCGTLNVIPAAAHPCQCTFIHKYHCKCSCIHVHPWGALSAHPLRHLSITG